VTNENRPVRWAALGEEASIIWEEDQLQFTVSHTSTSRADAPQAGNGGAA
jgi:hypothetical protein